GDLEISQRIALDSHLEAAIRVIRRGCGSTRERACADCSRGDGPRLEKIAPRKVVSRLSGHDVIPQSEMDGQRELRPRMTRIGKSTFTTTQSVRRRIPTQSVGTRRSWGQLSAAALGLLAVLELLTSALSRDLRRAALLR